MVTDNITAMKKYLGICMLTAFLAVSFIACDDNIDALITDLELDRALTPSRLEARIRNLTTIELTWNVREGVDHYIVEFSEDSLQFTTIILTDEVTADELPYQRAFDGETRYSARVKAVSNGVADSKWATVTIMTAQENIFLPIQDGDIAATEATLRWPANSEVTHFIINPGNTERAISAGEKSAGVATITGLASATNHTVILRNGTKHRGQVSFQTLLDIGDATAVYPEDDLSVVIANASSGDVLVLFPGDYTVNVGQIIALDKSISIKGLFPYDKPKLHVAFNLLGGATHVELVDLDLDGTDAITLDRPLNLGTASTAYGSVKISGCNIHDFGPQLIYGNVSATLDLFSVDNSIITNFSGGGDFIDFRSAYVKEVSLTNSTFNNCSPTRDFVRLDAAGGLSGTGLTSTVLIDHCTFYGVSTGASNRILYVRFVSNVLTVQNSLFASSNGNYSNQAATSQPTFNNNNYFEAPGYYTVSGSIKIDNSGTHTTLNPGFANAAAGNFTISNQTLIDNEVGDPRWRQ